MKKDSVKIFFFCTKTACKKYIEAYNSTVISRIAQLRGSDEMLVIDYRSKTAIYEQIKNADLELIAVRR